MFHTKVQQSTPASTEQIAEALKILFGSMPLPRGTDRESAAIGYIDALSGFPIEAIVYGIRKFLRGDCEDISPKFCPHPPELAKIVRGAMPNRNAVPTGKLYGYHPPKSKVIERNCGKEWAFRLIDQGIHPRGSIWCPGDINDKHEIGDLYGPDPDWKEAFPLWRDAA